MPVESFFGGGVNFTLWSLLTRMFTVLPSFLPRRRGAGRKPVFLYEDDTADIIDWGDRVSFNTGGAKWTKRYAALARRFKVTSLTFNNLSVPRGKSIDFVLDLPQLRALSIGTYEELDLGALERMTELRSLRLAWRVHRTPPPPVDFTALPNLAECSITLHPPFDSILRSESLRKLEVFGTRGRRHLDLTRLMRLKELIFDGCPGLRSFELHDRAGLKALMIANAASLRPDWPRVGRDLEYLGLAGRLAFPLEGIAAASKLRVLLLEVRTLPPLTFLKRFPRLSRVDWSPTAPEDGLSPSNAAVIADINARRPGRRKPVTPPS